MKKKYMCFITAFVLMVTLFFIPTSSMAYENTESNSTIENEIAVDGGTPNSDISEGELSEVKTPVKDVVEVELNSNVFTYTGKKIIPDVVSVRVNGVILEKGIDYSEEYEYYNNINPGTATVRVLGIGSNEGKKYEANFRIRADISGCSIKIPASNYSYSKKSITPIPVVTYRGLRLSAGKDYKVGYSNNYYPGTGKVTVTGINNYFGKSELTFSIGKISGLKVKSRSTSSIKLTWNKQAYVTGYKIYSYSFSKKKWTLKKTVLGGGNNYCTITKLGAGYGYKFMVKPYVKISNGKYFNGPNSATLSAQTVPVRVILRKFYASHSLYARAYWGKKICSGYQVKLSRSSSFSNSTIYTVKNANTLSKRVGKLRNNKTYYIKVRAYRTYSGKTVYGAWSKYKKVKTDGTGWVTSNGIKYYYNGGNKVTGSKTIDGKKYYFRTDTGAMSGVSYGMWKRVRNQASGTKYLIATSRDLNVTCVYSGSKGNWKLKYYWKCATGAAGTRTPAGRFSTPTTKPKLRYMGQMDNYTCWYATRFYKRCYYHSVLYNYMSHTSIQDGRLGRSLSHGCVRLAKGNAKWLYDNIKSGTKVIIY